MGRSLKVVLLKQTNMKLLLVLAAAGLSCAAPAFAYSIGHHPLVYTHHPAVTYTLPTAYHPVYHTAYGYPYGGLLPLAAPAAEAAEEPAVEEARKKREADPAVIGAFSTIKNPSPTIYHNVPSLAYAYAPYAHHLGYGVWGRKKREAEAEAEAEADPWL